MGVLWLDNVSGVVRGPRDGRARVDASAEPYGMGDIEYLCGGDEAVIATSTPIPSATTQLAHPTETPSPMDRFNIYLLIALREGAF